MNIINFLIDFKVTYVEETEEINICTDFIKICIDVCRVKKLLIDNKKNTFRN